MGILRVLLAFSVVYMHYGKIPGTGLLYGSAVVLGFFIVSGFYMSLVLTETYNGPNAIRLFYLNRFLRIFPAYLIVLSATALALIFVQRTYYMSLSDTFRTFEGLTLPQKLFSALPNVTLFGMDYEFLFKFDGPQFEFASMIAWR